MVITIKNKKTSSLATSYKMSKGRFFKEKQDSNRTPFQRDRDRIIHSSAFRRLEHKTQVFVHHEGDHYRSRLTHSLEVSQIARTISRFLNLDEDLSETIALAHDLGHTPFGHAGEEALNQAMLEYGGFDHNAQTLRIITYLEKKYLGFDGLNLTWETLEGIVKHNGPISKEKYPFAINEYNKTGFDLQLDTWCGPEAQVASLSDDIAYFSHDLEDGLRASFFLIEDLIENLSILNNFEYNKDKYRLIDMRRIIHELRRYIMSLMIDDLIYQSNANIQKYKPKNADDIRQLSKPLITFSNNMQPKVDEMRLYLVEKMYRNWKVNRMTSKAKRIVIDLFKLYYKEPDCLPFEWGEKLANEKNSFYKARVIGDYIAGMTDRYAIGEHKRLYDYNEGWE